MRVAGVAELKTRLSEYLASVRKGEEITITDRGKPIARLVPMDPKTSHDAHLAELARLGLVRLPIRRMRPEEIIDRPRPVDAEGRSLEAVLEERRESP